VAAAVAIRKATADLPATLVVLGTPSEESGGGKVVMVAQGVFDDVDAAMMFHPSRKNWFTRGALAAAPITVSFHGKAAHASSMPEKGINALDAMIQTFVGINALRQHVTSDVRIHGIITRGGDAPNVIPAYTEGQFLVRAATQRTLEDVLARFVLCAEGAARATGARAEFQRGLVYAERRNNPILVDLFAQNMRGLGVQGDPPPSVGGVGSSDIGNVSLKVPTIHPYLKIVPDDIANHTVEFMRAARTEWALDVMFMAAKGLAMTVLDLVYGEGTLDRAWTEFKAQASEA
jgi:amidohydrolase